MRHSFVHLVPTHLTRAHRFCWLQWDLWLPYSIVSLQLLLLLLLWISSVLLISLYCSCLLIFKPTYCLISFGPKLSFIYQTYYYLLDFKLLSDTKNIGFCRMKLCTVTKKRTTTVHSYSYQYIRLYNNFQQNKENCTLFRHIKEGHKQLFDRLLLPIKPLIFTILCLFHSSYCILNVRAVVRVRLICKTWYMKQSSRLKILASDPTSYPHSSRFSHLGISLCIQSEIHITPKHVFVDADFNF